MSIKRIAKILDCHSVPYYITDDKIFADSMLSGTEIFEEVVDMSDWSENMLYSWLGY